jgi:hypothetical protein
LVCINIGENDVSTRNNLYPNKIFYEKMLWINSGKAAVPGYGQICMTGIKDREKDNV